MSIVLTVTWLSVQTPTTCVIGITNTIISVRQNKSNLGANGLEVSKLVVERLPLLRLQLRQPFKRLMNTEFTTRGHMVCSTCCP